MVGAPVDVLGEQLVAVLERVCSDGLERAFLQTKGPAGFVPNLLLIPFRDAEQIADRAHWNLRAEILDEIEPTGTDQVIERAHAVLPRQRLDRLHPPWRENL